MLEQIFWILDKKEKAGAILTDLSKAFDSLDHKLLIAKLSAYGFGKTSLELIYSYLSSRKQRVKISNWGNISSGVPQGSILGPLLFNIFINDIFLFVTEIDIANYADDNMPYATDKCIELLLQKLESETSPLNEWFAFNHLKSNNDKNKLLVTHDNTVSVKIGNKVISHLVKIDSFRDKLSVATCHSQKKQTEEEMQLEENLVHLLSLMKKVSRNTTELQNNVLPHNKLGEQFNKMSHL